MRKNIIFGLSVLVIFLSTPLFMGYLLAEQEFAVYFLDTAGIRGPFLSMAKLLAMTGIGMEWSSRCYLFLMNLLCCILSYAACKRLTQNSYAALTGSICYGLSIYSIAIRYDMGTMGEIAAYAMLPLAAIGMIGIFRAKGWGLVLWKATIYMAIGTALVLYASIPIGIILIPFLLFISLLPGTGKQYNDWYHRLTASCIGIIGAILITLPVVLPYIRAAGNGILYLQDSLRFGQRGLLPIQLFQFFYGNNGGDTSNFSFIGLGLPFIGILFLCIALAVTGRINNGTTIYTAGRILLVTAIIPMVLSLRAFPWDQLSYGHSSIILILEHIGYPHRFLMIAVLALSLLVSLLGCWIMEYKPKLFVVFFAGIIVANVLSGVYLMNDLVYLTPMEHNTEVPPEWIDKDYMLYISK